MYHEVSLEEVLAQRDTRVETLNNLKRAYPNHAILSFKLNIPGAIKNTPKYQWAFEQGILALPVSPDYKNIQLDNKTGPEAYMVFDLEPLALKKMMIELEDHHPLGRIFDLDVLGVNRALLHEKPRKCIICDDEAHACSRSRKHTLEKVIDRINYIIDSYQNI